MDEGGTQERGWMERIIFACTSRILQKRGIIESQHFYKGAIGRVQMSLLDPGSLVGATVIKKINGACDAIRKGWLSQLFLVISDDMYNPNCAVEVYSWTFDYSSNSASFSSGSESITMTYENEEQAIKDLVGLLKFISGIIKKCLQPLPPGCFAGMRLSLFIIKHLVSNVPVTCITFFSSTAKYASARVCTSKLKVPDSMTWMKQRYVAFLNPTKELVDEKTIEKHTENNCIDDSEIEESRWDPSDDSVYLPPTNTTSNGIHNEEDEQISDSLFDTSALATFNSSSDNYRIDRNSTSGSTSNTSGLSTIPLVAGTIKKKKIQKRKRI